MDDDDKDGVGTPERPSDRPGEVITPSGPVTLQANSSLEVSARLAPNMSIFHVQSAALHARAAAAIERGYSGTEDVALQADHTAQVTGAIFAAVAFLEATINEFFDLSHLGASHVAGTLGTDATRLMGAAWEHILGEHANINMLDKYQLALRLAGKDVFMETDSQHPPPEGSFADVRNLLSLRNALMHYKMLWEGANEEKAVRRLRDMLAAKFSATLNPLYLPNSHFLHVYLGHGCAQWAVAASVAFSDEFYRRLGVPVPYEYVRERLQTD